MANVLNTPTHFNIGISIAEPTDMKLWGISSTHIKDAMIELARYSIANGYRVSYGGDLEYKHFINFPDLLREIVVRYNDSITKKIVDKKSVTNYLAWHISLSTTKKLKDDFSKFINLVETPAPNEVKKYKKDKEKIEPVLKARSLSKMRELMNKDIDARVLLAGKIVGSSGVYPGLVEECYLALKSKKPVYLLGGFGGCTYKIIELLQKKRPQEISLSYQTKQDSYKKNLIHEYSLVAKEHPEYNYPEVNYNKMVTFFEDIGIEGLNNGLTYDENCVLFETRNIKEMLHLLFKGVNKVVSKTN